MASQYVLNPLPYTVKPCGIICVAWRWRVKSTDTSLPYYTYAPNTLNWLCTGSLLGHRLRRWPYNEPAQSQPFGGAEIYPARAMDVQLFTHIAITRMVYSWPNLTKLNWLQQTWHVKDCLFSIIIWSQWTTALRRGHKEILLAEIPPSVLDDQLN